MGADHLRVQASIIVHNFLQHQYVRSFQIINDLFRYLPRPFQVQEAVEVFKVIGRNRKLPFLLRSLGRSRSKGFILTENWLAKRLNTVISKIVVNYAHYRLAENCANVDSRHQDECVIQKNSLGVGVVFTQDQTALIRKYASVLPVISDNKNLVVPIPGRNRPGVVNLHQHALKTFKKVHTVFLRVNWQLALTDITRDVVFNHLVRDDSAFLSKDNRLWHGVIMA